MGSRFFRVQNDRDGSSRRGCHAVVRQEQLRRIRNHVGGGAGPKATAVFRGARFSGSARSVRRRAPRRRYARRPAAGRTVVPSGEMRLLRRITDGRDGRGRRWMNSLGYYGYLDWQLNAEAMGDPDAEARLALLHDDQPGAAGRSTQPDSAGRHAPADRGDHPARDLLEAAAVRAHGRVLDRPLQHQHHHGRRSSRRLTCATSTGVKALGTFPAMLNAQRVEPGDADRISTTRRATAGRDARRTRTTRARSWSCTRSASTAAIRSRTSSRSRAASPAGAPTQHRRQFRAGDVLLRRAAGTTTAASSCSAYPIAAGGGFNDGLNVLNILANASEHRAFRLEEAAALAAQLRPVAGARRRRRGRVHAHRRRHQGARAPHPALRQRALGAAALQASVPLHRLGAPRDEREHDLAQHDSPVPICRARARSRTPGVRPTAIRRSSSTGAVCRCRAGTSRSRWRTTASAARRST